MIGIHVRTGTILLVAALLQASFLSRVQVFGVSADLLAVVALAAGFADGPARGAGVGFAAGLLMDLLVQTPFGLSSLTYLVVGYAAGHAGTASIRSTRSYPALVGFVGGGTSVALFVILGELVGVPLLDTPGLAQVTAVVATLSGFLMVPAVPVLRWAGHLDAPRAFGRHAPLGGERR